MHFLFHGNVKTSKVISTLGMTAESNANLTKLTLKHFFQNLSREFSDFDMMGTYKKEKRRT